MGITPQTNCTLEQIAEQLKLRDNYVLCGHVSPDGDCLGSQLALMHALKALGKTVTCVFAKGNSVSAGLDFMPGFDQIIPAADYVGPCDTFVSIDVQIEKRIGDALPLAQAAQCRVSVDHHAVDGCYADFNYVDADAASTSLLIWRLAELLIGERGRQIATCCYTGLITDTGCFQFDNTDEDCFIGAGQMLAAGANVAEIAVHVYQSRRLESLRLEALMLGNMEVFEEQGLVLSRITKQDFETAQARPEDTETFIDALRSCAPARVACLLREQDGTVRGSIRSKDGTDVSAIARDLGGGGHMAAAGFTIENSTIDASIDRVKARIFEQLQTSHSQGPCA